jgi:putative transposase
VIFKDDADYMFFQSLFARYIDFKPQTDSRSRPYPHMREQIELQAYCLMPNHIHLLVYQREETAISRFMLSLMTAYTMYFNKKYNRRGPLFENQYRAVLIVRDDYLQHISRYIHLNHAQYKTWRYSSYMAYKQGLAAPTWLNPTPILEMFDSPQQYTDFVNDYEDAQRALEEIKHDLANY